MSSIDKIHTPCKKCHFAEYDNITQVSCHLGLIEKYQESDSVEVLEAYDEEKEFFIVNKKKCAGYREDDYFKNNELEESSMEEKAEYVKNKLQLNYAAIINSSEMTLEEINEILSDLTKTKVNPSFVVLLVKETSKFTFNEYYSCLQKSGISCKWRIRHVRHKDETFIQTVHQIINAGAEDCRFIYMIDGYSDRIIKIADSGNDLVYNKFKRFAVLTDADKKLMLFSKFVYESALAHAHDIITTEKDHTIL